MTKRFVVVERKREVGASDWIILDKLTQSEIARRPTRSQARTEAKRLRDANVPHNPAAVA